MKVTQIKPFNYQPTFSNIYFTLEELVSFIICKEQINREENVSIIWNSEINLFEVYILAPNREHLLESSGSDLFTAFKKLYQKLYKKPVLEKPNAYFSKSFEKIVQDLSVYKQHLYLSLLKSGKWEVSMRIPFTSIGEDARGIGVNWNHAVVTMHRTLSKHGISIKI